MIAAVLLLCVCCTAAAKTSELCVPSKKVACFVPADDLSPSAPVRVDVCLGKTLSISLEKLSGNPACSWTRGAEPVHAVNGSRLLVLPALSEANSGEYVLRCETGNGVPRSVSVSLRVVKSRPTTPRLLLSQLNEQNSSPYFLCISGGCPEPTLGFSGGYPGSEISSSAFFNRGAMCCAENAAGQECTQLYDYDLERMQEDELSNITVQPDQSLLLRCRKKAYFGPYPKWDKGGLEMDENKLACRSYSQELCIKTDHHSNSRMTYLFIKSVNVSHSGTYTCRDNNRNKNVYVNVQAEGFLSVELEKSKIVSANDVSDTCLEARVSYHPVLRRCSWEAPNKMVTECIRQTWVTKHSTVKLCNPLQAGDYKLLLEAGGREETRTVSVCVAGRPTTPRLLLSQLNEQNSSPYFLCISGGCPEPTLGFSGGYPGSEISSSAFFNRGAMCCAENAAGQECTQLYDYDLERMQEDELSNITVQPDQSLLLRCRKKAYFGPYPKWDKGGLEMDENKLACHSISQELCIKTDHHSNSRMTYLFIKSVNVSHSGTYTCRNDNRNKNVYVNVQAEGFLSVELEKSKIVSANDVSDTCLEARVSYHPVLRRCSWEAPNKMVTECIRQTWVTKHSTVKLCNPLQAGDYKLLLEAGGREETRTVSVCVAGRPTTPRLLLSQLNEQNSSPYFLCISGGCPEPTLGFSGGYPGSEISSSAFFNRGAMCCAENAAGQECTQLYDYDLERMQEDELSNITVQPDQSLLLRCRKKAYFGPYPKWDKGGLEMDENKLACHSNSQELCIKTDHHSNSRMTYLFIKSVNVSHSGTYTCRNDNRNKNVYVNVQAEGFLSVELEKSKIVSANDVSDTCLEARVSYHPVLRRCSWEAPNKMVTECIRQTWVTKHSTVKLCNPLQAGDYKLLLEAGGREETRTVSVCVADTPMFTFGTGFDIMVETSSLVPANYTWMSCVSANDSICELDSSWTVIPDTSVTVTDFSCKKEILSSLNRTWVNGHHFRFCLTNSVGSWCKSPQFQPQLLRVSSASPDENFNLLKVSSLLLLVALVVVSVTLFYFIKKKKPKYQPQLQMIQMVGPSDNDYIYINFKDFEYDTKWEFPRENLELGKELGSGAFGMVVQATAYGISKPGVPQQVAVKMLKEKHHSVEKEALVSELKMLTHIGSHDNIVNLLGACTESGPTYLIFQYCCHGDLLNYLKKNRELYHKSVTDAFNKDRFSSLYQNLETKPGKQHVSQEHYVTMYPSATRGQDNIAILTLGSDNGNNFEDPEIVEELEDERPEDLQTLTFDDLLSFAFQVAKGMEFLSSKNCIHRDLAARNILVTKDRLVKIGDFGLARDIENDSNYVVRGNVRLPVKWMAPESTFQGIYTTKSDVWAYGILLWEVFSLGVTPYPGIKVDHNFYSMIERGFKMECPYYASDSVYGMMCKCWALNPGSRPSFSELVSFMCNQLTDREEKLYHNILEQKECVYTNAAATKATSALETQNKNKAANEYSQPRSATESKELETSAEEEKLLKPDAQRC